MKNIGPIGDPHMLHMSIACNDGSTIVAPDDMINQPIPCPCGCGAVTTMAAEMRLHVIALQNILGHELARGNPVSRKGMARILLALMADRNTVMAVVHKPGKPGAPTLN
jgi:hypothetical protein